eukprot:ANDGO_03364.mRNA.1 putative copper-transporting ATPase HMA5
MSATMSDHAEVDGMPLCDACSCASTEPVGSDAAAVTSVVLTDEMDSHSDAICSAREILHRSESCDAAAPPDDSCGCCGVSDDRESCAGDSCCGGGDDDFLYSKMIDLVCCAFCWLGKCCEKDCCAANDCCLVKKGYVPLPADEDCAEGLKKKVEFAVDGMTCADCELTVDRKLSKMPGVSDVRVSSLTHRVETTVAAGVAPSTEAMVAAIESLGFKARLLDGDGIHSVRFGSTVTDLSVFGMTVKNLRLHPGVVKLAVHPFPCSIPSDLFLTVHYHEDQCGVRDLLKVMKRAFPEARIATEASNASTSDKQELRFWLTLFLLSLVCAVPSILIAFVFPLHEDSGKPFHNSVTSGLSVGVLLLWILATPVQTVVCSPLYKSAWKALWHGGKMTMDALVVLSTFTAYMYSVVMVIMAMVLHNSSEYEPFFETSTILLCLIMFGRWLELLTRGQTTNILEQLMSLQATSAVLVSSSDAETEIEAEMIQRGDLLKVLPGSVVPADGIVEDGTTQIDESTISGESLPTTKQKGDTVYGSTINQWGCITVRVTRTIAEGTLAGIRKMVEEAQGSKTNVQRAADIVAGVFAPFIVFAAVSVFIVWMVLTETGEFRNSSGKSNITFSLHFALAVLVVSCPCAIGLAAPTAIMVGTGVAAKKFGILFRGGAVLETCHKANIVVFDKTGTLTLGKPSVVHVETLIDESEFLFLSGCAELGSEHPIGRSIVTYAKAHLTRALVQPDEMTATPGKGICATVNGRLVLIGTLLWMRESGVVCDEVARAGVYVAVDGVFAGWFEVFDVVRPEARFVVQYLQDRLKYKVYIASGDRPSVVQAVARDLGVLPSHAVGGLLPGDKAEFLKELKEASLSAVCFLGDGVNDSPALAAADVGIAVANASEISMSAAGVVLMKNDLRDLLLAIDLSRKTFRVIQTNFFWAFLYNVIAIPLAAGVFYSSGGVSIPPAIAGLSEIASSIPVILFSLLLKKYGEPKEISESRAKDAPQNIV